MHRILGFSFLFAALPAIAQGQAVIIKDASALSERPTYYQRAPMPYADQKTLDRMEHWSSRMTEEILRAFDKHDPALRKTLEADLKRIVEIKDRDAYRREIARYQEKYRDSYHAVLKKGDVDMERYRRELQDIYEPITIDRDGVPSKPVVPTVSLEYGIGFVISIPLAVWPQEPTEETATTQQALGMRQVFNSYVYYTSPKRCSADNAWAGSGSGKAALSVATQSLIVSYCHAGADAIGALTLEAGKRHEITQRADADQYAYALGVLGIASARTRSNYSGTDHMDVTVVAPVLWVFAFYKAERFERTTVFEPAAAPRTLGFWFRADCVTFSTALFGGAKCETMVTGETIKWTE